MTGLPIWFNILLLLASAGLGFLLHRILSRQEGLTIDNTLQRAPFLYVFLLLLLGMLGIHLYLQMRPEQAWHFPLWLEYWYTAIIWGVILGILGTLFSLACFVCYASVHPERHKVVFATCIILISVE